MHKISRQWVATQTWTPSMLDLDFLSTLEEYDVVIKLLVEGGHGPQFPYKEEEFYF